MASFLYCCFSQSAFSYTISIGNRGFVSSPTTALFHVRRRLLHQISSLTNRTNVLHYGGRIFSKEIDRVGTCPCYCANSRSKSPAFLGEDSLPGLFYSAYREIIPINGFRRILCPFENIFCNIGNHFLDIRCQIGSLQISTV